ncbi:hypothetical protein OXX59_007108 [Metschnikowia pulcherrima]
MSSPDLILALAVARVAVRNNVPCDEAVEEIGETLLESMKSRNKGEFVVLNLRPNRRNLIDITQTILKVKAVCRYPPSDKTVHSLLQLKNHLKDSKWGISTHQATFLTCHLDECLIYAASRMFTFTRYGEQTKDVMLDIAQILFSRTQDKISTLTQHLIAILAQLVFVFSFSNGCDHDTYTLFTSVTGIGVPKRPISNTVLRAVRVVTTTDIIKFHVEMLNMYCNKYDKESCNSLKGLVLACLLVYDEDEVFQYANLLSW